MLDSIWDSRVEAPATRLIGLRRLKRESNLSLTPVSNVLKGIAVRPRTLAIIRQTAEGLVTES